MQIASVIVRVPGGIKVVVWPGQARVERAASLGLFSVNLAVIVRILSLKDHFPATIQGKAVDQVIFPAGYIVVEGRQDFFVEADIGGPIFCPTVRGPSRVVGLCGGLSMNGAQQEK